MAYLGSNKCKICKLFSITGVQIVIFTVLLQAVVSFESTPATTAVDTTVAESTPATTAVDTTVAESTLAITALDTTVAESTTATTTVDTTTVAANVGEICSQTINCAAGLTCFNNVCNCTNTEYYNASNTGDLCLPKKSFGQSCNQSVECIANLSCITGTCRCNGSQYYDNSTAGALCRTKISYGNSCPETSATGVCKGPNTACTPPYTSPTIKLCLCATGYYRTDTQTCISRNNLKIRVKNVNRQTTIITIYWMNKSNRGDTIYNMTRNSGSATAAKFAGTAAFLTPGTLYTFVIYSNLNSDTNYPSFVEQSNYTNWTYPSKAGNVTLVFETSQESVYEITFNKSDGNVANYIMDITGGGITNSAITNTTSMRFQLTPATQYNYTLTAYNGNSPPDQSEPRTGIFLTPTPASSPVQGLHVTNVLEMTANITWRTPSDPNGNITGYLVQVLGQGTGICLYNIKLPCYNCSQSMPPNANDTSCTLTETAKSTYDNNTGYHLELPKLKPYHNYTVVVRAVNEKGNGRPNSTNITTKIAVANSLSSLTPNSAINENSWWVNMYISWIPGDYTGPTAYYILVQKGAGPDSNDFSSSNEYKVSDYYTNTLVLYDVQASWNYQISVKAGTSKGNSSSSVQPIKTAANRPGLVQDITVIQDTLVAKKINVSFLCPMEQDRNGTIESFVIRQTLSGSDNETVTGTSYNYTVDSTTSCKGQSTFINETNILVEKSYSFAVKAINNKYDGDFGKSVVIYINAQVPRLEENFGNRLVKPDSVTNLTTIRVEICSSCLTDNSQGDVTNVGLVVCVKGPQCGFPGRKKRSTVTNEVYEQLPTWKIAKMKDFTVGYRATPDNWIQTLNSNSQPNFFTIGTNKSCLGAPETVYCNGPLPSGKTFQITVIVCTSAGCDIFTSKDDFVTAQQVIPSQKDGVAAVVGGVLGGLAFILVICVIIFLILRFRKQNGEPSRMAPSRSEGIPAQKNIKTENSKRSEIIPGRRHIPDTSSRERFTLQMIGENENVYVEVEDYDYIESEYVDSSRHPAPDYADVKSTNVYETSNFPREFPYENTVRLSLGRNNRGYIN